MSRLPVPLFVLAAFAAAACATQPQAVPALPNSAAVPPEQAQVIDVWIHLAGHWQVARLDGARLPPEPIHMLFSSEWANAVSGCLPFSFDVDFEPRALPVGYESIPKIKPRSENTWVCERALHPEERRLPLLLAGTERIERLADGRVKFIGKAGTLIIERPDRPPVAPPWPMWGSWQVEAIDGQSLNDRIELVFGFNRVEGRVGCFWNAWTYQMADGTLTLKESQRRTRHWQCERDARPHEVAFYRISAQPLRVAAEEGNRRLLVGSSGSILLRRCLGFVPLGALAPRSAPC